MAGFTLCGNAFLTENLNHTHVLMHIYNLACGLIANISIQLSNYFNNDTSAQALVRGFELTEEVCCAKFSCLFKVVG